MGIRNKFFATLISSLIFCEGFSYVSLISSRVVIELEARVRVTEHIYRNKFGRNGDARLQLRCYKATKTIYIE